MKARILILSVLSSLMSALLSAQPAIPQLQAPVPDSFGYTSSPDTTGIGLSVGSVPGTFAVSPLGAATYSMPIECPPGVNGLQPQIGIAYNSQAGNGVVGYGFSITGLSCITRGPRTVYHDGSAKGVTFSNDDAFYIDGRRLVRMGEPGFGTMYAIDGSPQETLDYLYTGSYYFFVYHSSDGNTYYYGSTPSSQLYREAETTVVYAWYLDAVEDAEGNRIDFTYTDSASGRYVDPASITYNDGATSIDFTYELRPDERVTYVCGIPLSVTKRLSSISVRHEGHTLRTYHAGYQVAAGSGWSQLTSFTLSDAGGTNLSPTRFTWSPFPGIEYEEVSCSISEPSYGSSYHFDDGYHCLISADFDGDGLSDIIKIRTGYEQNGANRSNYTFAICQRAELNTDGSVAFEKKRMFKLPPNIMNNSSNSNEDTGPIVLDFDGDGKSDVFYSYWGDEEGNFQTSYSCIIGSEAMASGVVFPSEIIYGSMSGSDIPPLHVAADFNNDGHDDLFILERKENSADNCCHIVYYNTNGIGGFVSDETFTLEIPGYPRHLFASDFNGDGMEDLGVFFKNGYRIFLNKGIGLPYAFNDNSMVAFFNDGFNWAPERMFPGDFNGDGVTDFLMHSYEFGYNQNWYLAFGNGNCGFTLQQVSPSAMNGLYDNQESLKDGNFFCHVNDFDSDGRTDVFMAKKVFNGTTYVKTVCRWLKSTGSNLTSFRSCEFTDQDDVSPRHVVAGHFLGKGQVSLANYGKDIFSGGGLQNRWRFYQAEDTDCSNGKILRLDDGLGNRMSFSYGNLSNPALYSPGLQSAFPLSEGCLPINVTASVTQSNGILDSIRTDYSYKGLKKHRQGLGLLGFEGIYTINQTTGLQVKNEITDWNLQVCKPESERQTYISSGQISTTTTHYSYLPKEYWNYYHTYLHGRHYFQYPDSIIVTDFDGGTTIISSVFDENSFNLNRKQEKDILTGSLKEKEYSDYICCLSQNLPCKIIEKRKHPDEDISFTDTTLITYDAFARPTRVVHHAGTAASYVTLNEYDSWGNLTATVDSGHPTIRISHVTEYDATHRFPAATYIQTNNGTIAGRKQYTYDTWGNMLTETDLTNTAQPLTTTHAYDGWGNRLSTTAPTGHRTQYDRGRTADGYFTLRRGISQPWVKTTYDSTGRELSTETRGAGGIVVKTTNSYDTRGRLHTKTEQQGERTLTTSYTYDARDRITQVSDDTGSTSTFSYGLRSSTETIGGRTYTKTYDAWGNVKTSSDPVATVSYLYNSQGLPRSVTTAGSTVTMTYDQAGRRLTLTDPDAGTMTTAYDVLGNITRQTDARGKTVTYTYDKFGREQRKIYDGNSIARTYGTSGNSAMRLTSEYNTGMSVSYAYDGYGRIVSETRTADNSPRLFTYSYNPDGSLATVTYPDTVTVAYTYDCYGYRKGMTVDGQQAWTLGGKNGADIYWHLNGGCSLSHGYDKKGRLVSRTNYTPITISPVDGGLLSGDGLNGIGDHGSLPVDTMITDPGTPGVLLGTPVHEMTFTYDHQTGNLTSRTIGGITESFTYDSLDRLTAVTQGSSTLLSVSYGDGGNILSKTGLGSYSYDSGKPHAVTGVENTAGLVSDIPQTITYNGIGQATRIHQQAREAVITYGPDETRWKTAFTDTGLTRRLIRYYGDYEEVDSFGPHPGIPAVATKKYHWLPGDVLYVRQGGAGRLYYLATDHLGSIREVMKADGDLTSVFHADYDAWGRQTVSRDSIGIYRGYTGHEMLPEFGLINMNGRMYDPLLGRFLSPDNYVQLPDLSQSFNRYSYCLNNPLKYTDPSGEFFGFTGFLTGFVHGLWHFITKGGSFSNVFKETWKNGVNYLKVDWGMFFKGKPLQRISRFTWELPQTIAGRVFTEFRFYQHSIDNVGYYDGATYVYREVENGGFGGVTLGSFINIEAPGPWPTDEHGNFAPWEHPVFGHEYGHYLQSQEYGWGYLFSVGIPSLISAEKNKGWYAKVVEIEPHKGVFIVKKHMTKWFEMSANKKARDYFKKRGKDWGDETFPISISKILYYIQSR